MHMLSLTMLAGRHSPHATETRTCVLFWWHLPCSGYRPQLLFPFIPKEEQHLSPLVSAFIVSRPPASPMVGAERYSIGQGMLPCIKWWRWKEMPDSDSCLFLQLSVQPRRFEWALNSSAFKIQQCLACWRGLDLLVEIILNAQHRCLCQDGWDFAWVFFPCAM